ncbi:MAG: SPOR domain-containing protein [Saprospiraceae bacterium]|nr:SPOR domain-containing protein [Saprospiraceae bacterium]
MKNLINILLYVLLGLLVVAISYMVFKRFKSNTDTSAGQEAQSETSYIDTTGNQSIPFTAEDSLVLGLTGELPTQVGPDSDHMATEPQPTMENVSPVAQPVALKENIASKSNSENSMESKSETKSETKVTARHEAKATIKTESKANHSTIKKSDSKTKSQNQSSEKSSGSTAVSSNSSKGQYYVISGSFLVPNNADNQVKKLKKLGFFNAKKIVFKNASSYSAVAGQYDTESAARASLKKLKAKGEEGFIKKI